MKLRLLLPIVLSACGAIDAAFDCQNICSRYRECFDSNYDVKTCADRCRERARTEPDLRADSNVCSACIETRSCSEATFSCARECLNIVP